MNIISFTKKILDKLKNIFDLCLNSKRTVYISYVLLLILISDNESMRTSITLSLIIIIYYFWRIIMRYKKLKNLSFIDTDNLCFKKDSTERANQLLDITSIVFLSLNMIYKYKLMNYAFIKYKIDHTLVGIVTFTLIAAIVLFYYSIVKNSSILKLLSILCTAVYGLYICLFIVIKVISILPSLTTSGEGANTWMGLYKTELIMSLPIIVEFYIKEIIIIILLSILFQGILSFATPPYQLSSLEYAYKILNLSITFLASITLLSSGLIYDMVKHDKEELLYTLEQEHKDEGIGKEDRDFLVENAKAISNASYTRLTTVLFMPYTFGALISLLIIDLRKKKNEEKASTILKSSIKSLINDEYESKITRKKVMYFSGKKYLLDMEILDDIAFVKSSSNDVL